MADPPEQVTLFSGQKRTHDGHIIVPSQNIIPPSPIRHIQPPPMQRAQSPALSTSSSSLSELSSSVAVNPLVTSTGSPSKMLKLTFAEKQVARTEKLRQKDERAKQKEEEKARKEDEKRLKDDERRKKAEEREAIKQVKDVEKAEKEAARAEKKKAKDTEKAAKDAQKAQKEVERLKKERAQMRLGAFFGAPASASSPTYAPDDVSSGVSSRRSSITSVDMERSEQDLKVPQVISPDFSSWILPFFPHDHTEVAPHNRFFQSCRPISVGIPWLDNLQHTPEPSSVLFTETITPSMRRKRHVRPVKDIVQSLAGSEDSPIDLTAPAKSDLAYVSYKILSFREDFRPPYQGTFTRIIPPGTARKLSRNPTHRGMPRVDYDYNSEAEWEAPEAGDEDLEDDDEMSDEEDAADEMADFLDADGEETARRRVLTSDVEPICTGLCWEGKEEVNISGLDLARYRLDILHDDTQLPIDPYSPSHWSHSFQKTPLKAKAHPSSVDEAMPVMQPPRLPLVAVSAPNDSPLRKFITTNNALGGGDAQKENLAPDGHKMAVRVSKKPTKIIPHDLLPSFRAAVSGSDLNKVALIEILKKQFPKCPKDAIKGTLETIAVRQGAKEVDKRWVLVA